MFIGDGAKLVRDAFELAKEKSPAIIFIDELDAIGTKRFDSEKSGDREVQRTMLELLNQLDGFSSDERIKVCLHPGELFDLLTSVHHLRSSLQQIGSIFSIRLFFGPAVWIERLSSHSRMRQHVLEFSKFIPGR